MAIGHKQYSGGFTIIEILVAVLVLAIGLLGLAGLQMTGLSSVNNASRYTESTLAINDIIERMQANPLAINANDFSNINSATDIDCSAMPNPYCSQYFDGNAQVAAQGCTPTQMANYDLNVWFCGNRTGAATRAPGVSNLFPNAALTITCNDQNPASGADADPCTDGSPHTVVFSWDEQNANRDGGANPNRSITVRFKPSLSYSFKFSAP